MTTAEALAHWVLHEEDLNVDAEEEAFEVHDSLVGFAKGYEESWEYEFIEAYRNGDGRCDSLARKLLGEGEASVILEEPEYKQPEEENSGQLRLDI